MNRSRINWLVIAVTVLVLLNIGLMATIWLQKKAPAATQSSTAKGPDALPAELGFDSIQRLRFDSLREQHRATVRGYRNEMRTQKERFFDGVKRNEPASDSLAASIARLQTAIDKATYAHFQQVRALCRDDQKVAFDRLFRRILAQMGAPPPRHDAAGPRPGGRPGDGPDGPHDRMDGPPDGPPPGEGPPPQ